MTKRKKLKGTGKDRATIGGSIGSFLFPLGGGIAYFRIKDEYPKAGKAYGMLALISIVLMIFWRIFYASTEKTLGKVPKKKLKAVDTEDSFWQNYAFRKDIVFSDDIEIDDLRFFEVDIDELTDLYLNKGKWNRIAMNDGKEYLLVVGRTHKNRYLAMFLDYNPKSNNIEVINFYFPDDNDLEKYYYSQLKAHPRRD